MNIFISIERYEFFVYVIAYVRTMKIVRMREYGLSLLNLLMKSGS
jgi:hypothetical protein